MNGARALGWRALLLTEPAPNENPQEPITSTDREKLVEGTIRHVLHMREAFPELFIQSMPLCVPVAL